MERLLLSSFFTMILLLIKITSAYDFYVGGRDGWAPNPKENFNSWAGRMRFQVNDKLVFKYKKEEDSVLVVQKEDYDSCNVNNPIQKLEGGDSVFQFGRSGPFYFISGNQNKCSQGEKLIVVVMAVRNKKPPPSPSPPLPSPPPSKAPALSPSASSPSPSSSNAPAFSPSASSPSPSSSKAPAFSPSALSPSSPPSSSPSPSPSSVLPPISSPSPSPSSKAPSLSPSASPSSSKAPILSPSASSSPPSSTGVSPAMPPSADNEGSEPATASASSVLTVSSLALGLVILALGHVLLG